MQNPFIENMKNFMGNQNFGNVAAELVSRNTETVSSAAQLVARNTQNLMRKNAEMLQESTSSIFNIFKNMSNNNAPEQLMHKAQDSMRDVFDNALSHSKELAESMSKTSMEVFDIFSKRASENLNEYMQQASNVSKGNQFQQAAANTEKKK